MNNLEHYNPVEIGYEVVQCGGSVEGGLLGGCLDVFIEVMGTSIWPT